MVVKICSLLLEFAQMSSVTSDVSVFCLVIFFTYHYYSHFRIGSLNYISMYY